MMTNTDIDILKIMEEEKFKMLEEGKYNTLKPTLIPVHDQPAD